ncbi:hypothetical protein BpHYR1_006197, partial [Brachionus plicatilis]
MRNEEHFSNKLIILHKELNSEKSKNLKISFKNLAKSFRCKSLHVNNNDDFGQRIKHAKLNVQRPPTNVA